MSEFRESDEFLKLARKVRTPEGARYYGQPIGSVILKDLLPPGVPRLPGGGGASPAARPGSSGSGAPAAPRSPQAPRAPQAPQRAEAPKAQTPSQQNTLSELRKRLDAAPDDKAKAEILFGKKKPDAPKVKKPDAPKPDAPKADAPKADAPKQLWNGTNADEAPVGTALHRPTGAPNKNYVFVKGEDEKWRLYNNGSLVGRVGKHEVQDNLDSKALWPVESHTSPRPSVPAEVSAAPTQRSIPKDAKFAGEQPDLSSYPVGTELFAESYAGSSAARVKKNSDNSWSVHMLDGAGYEKVDQDKLLSSGWGKFFEKEVPKSDAPKLPETAAQAPAGTALHRPSEAGDANYVYVKNDDGTWTLYNNGKTVAPSSRWEVQENLNNGALLPVESKDSPKPSAAADLISSPMHGAIPKDSKYLGAKPDLASYPVGTELLRESPRGTSAEKATKVSDNRWDVVALWGAGYEKVDQAGLLGQGHYKFFEAPKKPAPAASKEFPPLQPGVVYSPTHPAIPENAEFIDAPDLDTLSTGTVLYQESPSGSVGYKMEKLESGKWAVTYSDGRSMEFDSSMVSGKPGSKFFREAGSSGDQKSLGSIQKEALAEFEKMTGVPGSSLPSEQQRELIAAFEKLKNASKADQLAASRKLADMMQEFFDAQSNK